MSRECLLANVSMVAVAARQCQSSVDGEMSDGEKPDQHDTKNEIVARTATLPHGNQDT